MKKSLLLVALVVASLVGCKEEVVSPEKFQYDQYAYFVTIPAPAPTAPAGLVAFEVTYVDANGTTKKETITKSWAHKVPAKKGVVMKMTSKMVLAPGAVKPTSGDVNYCLNEGIAGVNNNNDLERVLGASMYENKENFPYQSFISALDEAKVRSYEYELKPR